MKTLSIKQLEQIKECRDEIKMGVYDWNHMKRAYQLIEAHYDNFEFYSPSIRSWYSKNYKEALAAAHASKLNREMHNKLKEYEQAEAE